MNFEPQKFFIGLIDFFSILLPGALLTFIIKEADESILFGINVYLNQNGTEKAVVFLFSSYLLGHFLFLVGSILDDCVYDPIRKRTEEKQIENLIYGKRLSPFMIRWLASLFFKKRPNRPLSRVVKIKEAYLKKIGAPETINAFQWCKLRLINENPEALLIVNRFEANSKFFRSFLPILVCSTIVSTILVVASYHPPVSIDRSKYGFMIAGSSILLLLAFWRYMEQRFKATQQAYWAVLALEAADAPPISKPDENTFKEDVDDLPTHAGGVVYRQGKGKPVEYLLVQAKKNTAHWVLPKGHIEADEKENFCALREVREETGIWATIVKEKRGKDNPRLETEVDLGITAFTVDDKKIKVRFYLMKHLKNGTSQEKRELKWRTYDKAKIDATHDQTRDVLTLAESKRAELEID